MQSTSYNLQSATPLANKHIIVTRAQEQSGFLAEQLRALGATVSLCPLIAIAPPDDLRPLDAAIERLDSYDWLLLTSANAVRALFGRIAARGTALPTSLKIGAVGTATAAALAARSVQANVVPAEHTADALLHALPHMTGQRVLLPAADIARDTLVAGVQARGASVDLVTAYRTIPGAGVAQAQDLLQHRSVDAITFASPSAVRALLDGFPASGMALLANVALVCIGPTTAAAVRATGLPVAAVAQPHSAEGLIAALVTLYARS